MFFCDIHLISKLSIIFSSKGNLATYPDSHPKVGERIVFDQKSALEFTNIIEKVGEGIKKINGE